MSRLAERRISGPVATAFVSLLAMAGAGCGHGNSQPETAVGSSAAGATTQKCRQGGKPSDDCCAAMMDEGDALLAAGNKQGAYDKYEETRSACLKFHPVRKRIFLVTRTGPVEEQKTGPTADAVITVDFDLDLGEDVRGIGHVSYLDGELVDPGSRVKGLRPGKHELAIEVYVNPASGQGLSPVRLDVHQPIVLSPSLVGRGLLVGGAKVRVSDRGGAGTLQDRLSFSSEPVDFDNVVMLPPKAGSERLITDITEDPYRPRLPPALEFHSGNRIWGMFKVCVEKTGAVAHVRLIKSADQLIDAKWMKLIRTWRYRPYEANGVAQGFCYPLRLEVAAVGGPSLGSN